MAEMNTFLSEWDKEKKELKARIRRCDKWYKPQLIARQRIREKIKAAALSINDEKGREYYRRLWGLWYFIWHWNFVFKMREIIYTILEITGFDAFKEFINEKRNEGRLITIRKATAWEAYDLLTKVHPARAQMFLSFANNDSALYEQIQKKDYDGFVNSLVHTTTGVDELLYLCYHELFRYSEAEMLISFNYGSYDETDLETFLQSISQTTDVDTIKSLRSLLIIPNRFVMSDEFGENRRRLFVLGKYHTYLKDFCKVNHNHYYRVTYRTAIDDVICDPIWVDTVAPIYFFKLQRLGYSIKEEVIDKNDPEHIIVTKAKEYLKHPIEYNQLEVKKGRKKGSWIKGMNDCPEELLGHLFKDEIWPELEKRLMRLTYKDANDIDLRGRDLKSSIQALGACFIFYVTDSLGYAERTWVSFERTTKTFLRVSRNTISSYMSILDEYDRWLMKDKSNLDIFKNTNSKYYKLLLYNVDSFTDIISYLTPRIKKLFEENLTMKSKD